MISLAVYSVAAGARVPLNKTFRFDLHQYFIDEYSILDRMEYGANYIAIRNESFSIAASPFQLCFFNTTPYDFILGLRAGHGADQAGSMRWVWDANRNNPVHDGAALIFGTDGNLVLVDADGTVAWQTNTVNKGVTGLKLINNGNLVLHDTAGRFVWQSFDYPTSSAQNLAYSKVSPADFVNSTIATSGAISATSAVIDSRPFRPFRPSVVPCSFTLKSFILDALKFSPFATPSIFAITAPGEHRDVNMYPDRRLFSNRFDRSKPDDIDEISSNALKNLGEGILPVSESPSGESPTSGSDSSTGTARGRMKPFLNHGFREGHQKRKKNIRD